MKQSELQIMQKTSEPEGYRKKSTSSSTGDPRRKQQNRLCLKAKGQLRRLTRSKPGHLIWALLRNKHGNGLEVSRTCCRVWRQVAVLEQGADSLVWSLWQAFSAAHLSAGASCQAGTSWHVYPSECPERKHATLLLIHPDQTSMRLQLSQECEACLCGLTSVFKGRGVVKSTCHFCYSLD